MEGSERVPRRPPALRAPHEHGYRELFGDLGIGSLFDLRGRYAEVETFLSRLWAVAETITAANPGLEDDGAPGIGGQY